MSRQVGGCRCLLSQLVGLYFGCDIGRDRSRRAATCRRWSHLFNVCNVLCDGRGRDKIFVTKWCFDTATIEMAFRAITLDAAISSGVAGVLIAQRRLFNRESEFAVGGCRDRSRLVVGHTDHDTAVRCISRRLSPHGVINREPWTCNSWIEWSYQ